MSVHNHGIDPTCKERLVGECLLGARVVVLDLSDWKPEALSRIPAWLREKGHDAPSESAVRAIADQIEAQTKPPRIPEPTELFAVVEASLQGTQRAQFVRADHVSPNWFASSPGWADWGDLIDPVLIREGVDA